MNSYDVRGKIILAAWAIIAVMILFPPKKVTSHLLGMSETKSAGYQFILSDPRGDAGPTSQIPGAEDVRNALESGGVDYVRLIIQFAIVGGLCFGALKLMDKNQSVAHG
jgi:hypothetical protein